MGVFCSSSSQKMEKKVIKKFNDENGINEKDSSSLENQV